MKKRTLLSLICLLAVCVLSCGSAHKTVQVQPPVQAPQNVAKAQASESDQTIAQARQAYFLGERELNLGHLDKAKEQFDASLDLLMTYQGSHEPDPKVEAVINELEDKIFNHEMAALKEGDGFSEHPLEPALIDDLKNIDTFPPADQQTKQEVEQELKTATYDIPVEVNDTVLSFIRIFQNSRRDEFVGGLIRSGRYLDRMKAIFREEGIPEDLAYTALIESSFKSNAYSHARAKGFWQFISGTARRYDLQMDWWVDERSDFEKSTRAAARYLKDLYGMFGDWYLALAGYNAGENKIIYGLRRSGATNFWQLARTGYIRQETKNYVPAILAGMILAKDPQKYGFSERPDNLIAFDTVTVNSPIDLRLVAECSGVTLEEMKVLNPELNRSTTPKGGSYTLRIPKNTKQAFVTELASIPDDKWITWRKHEVKPGETLNTIASIYRTSVNSIASANSFNASDTLAAGQKLVIPIGRTTPAVSYSKASYRTSSRSKSSAAKKIVYKVKRGDTLYQIANLYDTDVDSIKRWNKINSGEPIVPGDRLTIYRK